MHSRQFSMTNLETLEAESIYTLREIAAEFERPVLLYSVGKDSSVLLHLARKAFEPAPIPFPLLHVDTGYKFREMTEFRDRVARELGVELIVFRNEDAIRAGAAPEPLGTQRCCSLLKTEALLMALREHRFDAAIGGARRDEERSRAKERIYSFRNQFGAWDPRNQRPELWEIYNGKIHPGESIRAFPLSNWTELDVWMYISEEKIEVNPLYFAQVRKMVDRGGVLFPADGTRSSREGETLLSVSCRYRSLGCTPCTGAIRSTARTLDEVVEEMLRFRTSERASRIIDHDVDGSMEKKKREGYF